MSQPFDFSSLVELCRRTHNVMQVQAGRSVDMALVVRNWLFGRYIVEFEQNGADRAEYGAQLIERLASDLRIKGTSATNLRKFRQFYREYPIQQAVSVESGTVPTVPANWQAPSVELMNRFSLSWSHYVTLLSIENPEERRFYEIEAREGSWGTRELERQIASSLYERLSLSRNKDEIRRLSEQGLVVEKAADLIKNPLVLEFLALDEKPSTRRTSWKPPSSTSSKASCWNWARGSCSKPGRSASPSRTTTSTWTSSSTTGSCAATSSST